MAKSENKIRNPHEGVSELPADYKSGRVTDLLKRLRDLAPGPKKQK